MKISRLIRLLIVLTVFISISNICVAQSLGDRVKKIQQEIKEKQRIESIDYNQTCRIGTINALRDYLKEYERENYVPKEHITDIKNRIKDFDVWSKAKSKHTISAYESYIRESKYKSYVNEANDAIADIKSIDEWGKIKNTVSIQDINRFLTNYPKTSLRSNAQSRIYELTAVDFYKSGDLLNAYKYFDLAGGKYAIASENKIYYEKSEEYYEYTKLKESSREFTLTSYLNKYPNSDYYNEVSNMVAIAKTKNFTMNTKDDTFNSALNYAKDKDTRNRVQAYIDISKNEYAQHKRNQRAARRYANGGLFQLGFEPLDLGWNGITTSIEENYEVINYNIGLSLKLGNYKDPIQFEAGVKPGLLFFREIVINDTYYDSKTKFHMPVFAKLKINFANYDNYSKLYLSGLGYYNAVRNDFLENEFSVGGGIGIAWRHWDWLMLYYKQDLNDEYDLANRILGTSFTYYF